MLIKRTIMMGLIFVIACGGGEKRRTGGTLVIGINGEPDALNPLTALSKPARDIMSLVFRRLADIDEDLVSFTPQLARSWEFSEDGLEIVFHLRSDVLWHDGTPFTAQDVVFTYEMHVSPEVAWDGISFKENISRVEATDDSTAVFRFSKRTPTMLMDAVEGNIVPAHLLYGISPEDLRTAQFNRHPVGTGPFRFVEWKSQQSISLAKFDEYYEKGGPYLDRAIFKVVPNTISLWQQLLSGDIDFMEGVPPRDFARLTEDWEEGKTDIRPIEFFGKQYDFIGWNLIDPENYAAVINEAGEGDVDLDRLLQPNKLFGNQKVRAALTMAIDRSTLADVVNQGMAERMDGPIPLIWAAYNPGANRIWPYDPDLALQYLNEEGWIDTDGDGVLDKDGVNFTFEMATNSGNERREQALTIIQEQLRRIGVEMTPRVADPGLLFGRMLPTRDFDAVLMGWTVGLKMDLAPLFHSSSLLMPFNFASFTSGDFDPWETIAKESFDRVVAQEYWDKIAWLLSYELPYTWLYYKMDNVALHKRFSGTIMDKRGAYVNLEDWWVWPPTH